MQVARSAQMFVAGRRGRSVHMAVQQLPTACADAIEDRSVAYPLPLEISANASDNFLFANPCFLLIRPVVALLLPYNLSQI